MCTKPNFASKISVATPSIASFTRIFCRNAHFRRKNCSHTQSRPVFVSFIAHQNEFDSFPHFDFEFHIVCVANRRRPFFQRFFMEMAGGFVCRV